MAEVTRPYQVGKYWTNLISSESGESVNFEEVEAWVDGTPMDDSKVDGVVYRKLPSSVGGGYVRRCWSGAFKMKWAGVYDDGITDNTLIYDKVISALVPNTVIEWEPNGKYVGSFISNKPFTILGNNSSFINKDGTSEVFAFYGDVDTDFGTLSAHAKYGDSMFETDSASGLVEGDLVALVDAKVRHFDGLEDVNLEVLKIKSVDGVEVSVYDMIRSDQNLDPCRIWKITPLKNIGLYDIHIPVNNLHSGWPIRVMYAEDVVCKNIRVEKSYLMALSIRYTYNVSVDTFSLDNGQRREIGGRAYGVHLMGCRNGILSNITGRGLRHLVDLATCYTISIRTVRPYDSFLASVVLSHNAFGGNLYVEDVVQEGGISVVDYSSQSMPNSTSSLNFIMRDLTIKDIRHVITSSGYESITDKRIRSVSLGASLYNLTVDNVSLHFAGNLEDLNANDHSVFRCRGRAAGPVLLNNIKSNRCGSLIRFFTEGDTPSAGPTQHVMEITNTHLSEGLVMFNMGGINRFRIKNANFYGQSGNFIRLTQLAGIHTSEMVVDGFYCADTVSFFDKSADYSTQLIDGGVFNRMPAVKTYSAAASTRLSSVDVLGGVVVLNNETGAIVTFPANFLPAPTFHGQKFLIKATGASMGISGGAQNFLRGRSMSHRLESGYDYVFEAVLDGGVLKWQNNLVGGVVDSGVRYDSVLNRVTGVISPNGGGLAPSDAQGNYAYTFAGTTLAGTVSFLYNQPSDDFRVLTFAPNGDFDKQRSLITNEMIATPTTPGIVLQAGVSGDTSGNPSATYSQAEVQAILTELRDLKTKMRAAGLLAT